MLPLAPALVRPSLPLVPPPHAATRRNAPAAAVALRFMRPILVSDAAANNPLKGSAARTVQTRSRVTSRPAIFHLWRRSSASQAERGYYLRHCGPLTYAAGRVRRAGRRRAG